MPFFLKFLNFLDKLTEKASNEQNLEELMEATVGSISKNMSFELLKAFSIVELR